MPKKNKFYSVLLLCLLGSALLLTSCGKKKTSAKKDDVITLRVCNVEEYIDEGGWDEDEVIELDNGEVIFGENSMVDDFETWYYETYGKKVKVEYSTFGTNEDLYNQLTLGDTYDLICPSDYMIMKLMYEGKLEPWSDDFYDASVEENYYAKGVSDYIDNVFNSYEVEGEKWSKYAVCYMWGTTGIVYNPEYVSDEEASSWTMFMDSRMKKRLTVKDSVRDTIFMAMSIANKDVLTDPAFMSSPDYHDRVFEVMNNNSQEMVNKCEEVLRTVKENAYSFETDSGKADMVIGRVWANYQYSGDAVYSLDQAEEDGIYLKYSIPKESSNLWFDGWVMPKNGINKDAEKKQAAEAFVNFLSRPDNVVRNMYYIGYTSGISGGDDDTVEQYVKWLYEADEDAEETVEYDISYFFGEGRGIITADSEQLSRQLFGQYPDEETMDRLAIMWFYDEDESARINRMWINIRCFDPEEAVIPAAVVFVLMLVLIIAVIVKKRRNA